MENELEPFERFQLERYGNILKKDKPVNENEDDADLKFEKWQEVFEIERERENY